jgi:lipoate-protein ligase A
MFCINLESNDPFFNLAIEEFLLKNSREEYLILYVNSPSVIIGKHQTGHREVNTRYITEKNIPVIRRISGGGTVYHDHGNLNFSFIRRCESGKQVDFIKYTKPVIDFLDYMGVEAKFEGKNDLKIDGLKISGNAEHVHGNRILHHGTLLYNTSLDSLRNSIRKDISRYSSRAVASNPSPVVNLNEKLVCYNDVSELRSEMINYFLKNLPDTFPYDLTEEEILQAESIAFSKYHTWEWNWAYGPEYNFKNSFEIQSIPYSCNLEVRDGKITECVLEGSKTFISTSKKLIGCRHMVSDMEEFFRIENVIFTEEDIYNFF